MRAKHSRMETTAVKQVFPSTVMLKREVTNRFLNGKRIQRSLIVVELLCASHKLVKFTVDLEAANKRFWELAA